MSINTVYLSFSTPPEVEKAAQIRFAKWLERGVRQQPRWKFRALGDTGATLTIAFDVNDEDKGATGIVARSAGQRVIESAEQGWPGVKAVHARVI